MNERWLVTAFRPGRQKCAREHSQKFSQAARNQNLFNLHAHDVRRA